MHIRASVIATISAAVVGRLVVAPALAAQEERTPRQLIGTPTEFPTEFSFVRSVLPLPDGRLVVTDSKEVKVLLLDWSKGSMRELGRKGSGPQEFQQVSGVSHARGGGVLVFDPQENRFLPITPQGQLQDVLKIQPAQGGTMNFRVISGGSSRSADLYTPDTLAAPFGSVYSGLSLQISPTTRSDSTPITRVSRVGDKVDTMVTIKMPERKTVELGTGMVARQAVRYSPADAWNVAPDGSVVVVRAQPYRVEWYPVRGAPTIGPVVAFAPIPVSKAEKDSILAAGRGNGRASAVGGGGRSITFNNGQPGASPQSISIPQIDPVILDVKPAFPYPQLPFIDESGRVWVERYQPATRKGHVYDVFDRRGALVDRVELPPKTRLAGFDAASLYAVRIDDDDLQHLQKYPLR